MLLRLIIKREQKKSFLERKINGVLYVHRYDVRGAKKQIEINEKEMIYLREENENLKQILLERGKNGNSKKNSNSGNNREDRK